MNATRILAGVLLLLLGRQLFWLFVGLAGFMVTADIVAQALSIQPDWLVLVIALVVGVIGAVIALLIQRAAVGIAGFLAGGYILFTLLGPLGLDAGTAAAWVVVGVGAVLGAVLATALLDWALIVLSSLAGAAAIVQSLELSQPVLLVVFLGALLLGIIVQARALRRS